VALRSHDILAYKRELGTDEKYKTMKSINKNCEWKYPERCDASKTKKWYKNQDTGDLRPENTINLCKTHYDTARRVIKRNRDMVKDYLKYYERTTRKED
jgi:hypothetical protein